MSDNDSFRILTPEQADRLVYWGTLAFAAIGYAYGGY